MKNKFKLCADIFLTFLKIGGFTIGGGYAMLPLIQREVVDVKGWVSEDDMTSFVAISQACPGAFAVNAATAVGLRAAGFFGAVSAALGMTLPSILIIILIAMFFNDVRDVDAVSGAFKGARAAILALMFVAVIRLYKTGVNGRLQIFVAIFSAICVVFLKISPQYVIFGAVIFGAFSGKRA